MAEVLLRTLVDTHRDRIKSVVTRHRGRSVVLFGSVARGEETPDSDLDFLVEFDTGASLFDLVRIEMDLQELLGRPVDVVSVGGLLPDVPWRELREPHRGCAGGRRGSRPPEAPRAHRRRSGAGTHGGKKARPFLILARDSVIPLLDRVLAVPSTTRRRAIPTEVDLDEDDGMPRACVLSLDNTQPITRSDCTRRITTLGADRLREVCQALQVSVDC